jgi:hypothetical protein
MIVPCPHCSETIYETMQLEGPYNRIVGGPPKIYQEQDRSFIVCRSCQRKVDVIHAGNGFRISPVQLKD